ncbi:MAG: hypothetical protein ACO23V_10485, partial [Chitinophagaceae bacterium]
MGIMDNLNKIEIINNRISNLNFHIDILSKDIIAVPDGDIEGKTPRHEILNNLIAQKTVLEELLTNLS